MREEEVEHFRPGDQNAKVWPPKIFLVISLWYQSFWQWHELSFPWELGYPAQTRSAP
jgi:hypothetical protein